MCLPSLDHELPLTGQPVLGAISDLPQVVVDNAIDVVIVAGHYLSGSALRRRAEACRPPVIGGQPEGCAPKIEAPAGGPRTLSPPRARGRRAAPKPVSTTPARAGCPPA